MNIKPIKGMPDFYPEDQEILEYIKNKWLNLGKLFGYKGYDGPILEPIELYLEKTSEEIVKEQTFLIKDRKNKTFVMRPEMTPTLARMIVKKEFELPTPIRWQSFGRFFRYEKPQKGRTRAFNQWNIDLIGEDNIPSDLEILEIAAKSLSILGLSSDEVKIKFNNRKILQDYLINNIGLSSDTSLATLRIIDRIDKNPIETTQGLLQEQGIDEGQSKEIIDFFLDDSIEIGNIWFDKILSFSKEIGISKYLEFDKKIIRGFDYYTGLVFEAWADSSLKRAIFGGGRYNNLTQTVGGKRSLPGVGFAIGDVAIIEVLKELNKLPLEKTEKVLFIPLNEEAYIKCKKYSAILQDANIISVIFNNYTMKIQKAFKYANGEDFSYAVIVGSTELENNEIRVKDLNAFQEQVIDSDTGISMLIERLKQSTI